MDTGENWRNGLNECAQYFVRGFDIGRKGLPFQVLPWDVPADCDRAYQQGYDHGRTGVRLDLAMSERKAS